MNKTSVTLTNEELLLLNGEVNDEVQKEINKARARLADIAALLPATTDVLTENQIAFISSALEEARTKGQLSLRRTRINKCGVCGSRGGYATYKRSSRYHRKGEPNYDKPLTLYAIELAERFIRFKGHATVGCCNECFKIIQPHLKTALAGIRAQLPEELTDEPERYKRYRNQRCKGCGWEGHEGEMGPLQTLMRDGHYPGQCPACGVKSLPFGPTVFETTKGFSIVDTAKDKEGET